jgi:hypothetical protein
MKIRLPLFTLITIFSFNTLAHAQNNQDETSATIQSLYEKIVISVKSGSRIFIDINYLH